MAAAPCVNVCGRLLCTTGLPRESRHRHVCRGLDIKNLVPSSTVVRACVIYHAVRRVLLGAILTRSVTIHATSTMSIIAITGLLSAKLLQRKTQAALSDAASGFAFHSLLLACSASKCSADKGEGRSKQSTKHCQEHRPVLVVQSAALSGSECNSSLTAAGMWRQPAQ